MTNKHVMMTLVATIHNNMQLKRNYTVSGKKWDQ